MGDSPWEGFMRIVRNALRVSTVLPLPFVILGCTPFPSHDISWQIAMTSGEGRAFVVDFKWKSGQLSPVIHQYDLPTVDKAESVWSEVSRTVYATKEVTHDEMGRELGWIRVYGKNGELIGEYQNGSRDSELSSPVLLASGTRMVFVADGGQVMGAEIDAAAGRCNFQEEAVELQWPRKRLTLSELLLPIEEDEIAVSAGAASAGVLRVSMSKPEAIQISDGRLVGVVDGAPVAVEAHKLVRLANEGRHAISARMTYRALKGPYRVHRLSPCGKFLFYDSGELPGFRLRLADLQTDRDCVLWSLGEVVSIGSWYEATTGGA